MAVYRRGATTPTRQEAQVQVHEATSQSSRVERPPISSALSASVAPRSSAAVRQVPAAAVRELRRRLQEAAKAPAAHNEAAPKMPPRMSAREKSGMPRLLALKRARWRCEACGSQRDLQFDHIVALDRGGLNEADNIRVLCADCHSTRHAGPG